MDGINQLIATQDVVGIKSYMQEHGLVLDGNTLRPKDETVLGSLKKQAEFWDQRQYARKILLNSLN